MPQHKWHKEIKAWADGAEIEYAYFRKGDKPEWRTAVTPWWHHDEESKGWVIAYRIKNKWQKEMDAHEEGKPIQYRERRIGALRDSGWPGWSHWVDCSNPGWYVTKGEWEYEYRIKPEPKVEVVTMNVHMDDIGKTPQARLSVGWTGYEPNVQLTFTDGKLTKLEII
jgi:hypothetical protein